MRATLNDLRRRVVALALSAAAIHFRLRHRRRLWRYAETRDRLRQELGVAPDKPLSSAPSDPPQGAGSRGADLRVAETSGTGGSPTRVGYSPERLRMVRAVFVDALVRAISLRRIRTPSLYVFGPIASRGASLTSLLLEEQKTPSRWVSVQAPYRLQSHPALARLAEEHGEAALRLLVLVLANPGILYATNPSSLTAFFDALEADWRGATVLCRHFLDRKGRRIPRDARGLLRRLLSRGYRSRLARVVESDRPLGVAAWAPRVEAHVCWTGGYVRPFLERLDRHLAPARVPRIPMYSMSTETIETVPDYRDADTAFLPAAPGVFYEFLPADSKKGAGPGELLPPGELESGGEYEMVVSHRFGLARYRTGDVFRVERMVSGLPDLRFLRRRGLWYSFTGEKITGRQAAAAIRRMEKEFPGLRDSWVLALLPSEGAEGRLPGYRLIAVRSGAGDRGRPADIPAGLPGRFEEVLARTNVEYRDKRRSGRLAAVGVETMSEADFKERLGVSASDDSQFKFVPFYPRLWPSTTGSRHA